jgi:hypothetical protein
LISDKAYPSARARNRPRDLRAGVFGRAARGRDAIVPRVEKETVAADSLAAQARVLLGARGEGQRMYIGGGVIVLILIIIVVVLLMRR